MLLVTQYLAVYTNFLSKSSLYIKKSSQDRILFNSFKSTNIINSSFIEIREQTIQKENDILNEFLKTSKSEFIKSDCTD
jgi:hypothetical protein